MKVDKAGGVWYGRKKSPFPVGEGAKGRLFLQGLDAAAALAAFLYLVQQLVGVAVHFGKGYLAAAGHPAKAKPHLGQLGADALQILGKGLLQPVGNGLQLGRVGDPVHIKGELVAPKAQGDIHAAAAACQVACQGLQQPVAGLDDSDPEDQNRIYCPDEILSVQPAFHVGPQRCGDKAGHEKGCRGRQYPLSKDYRRAFRESGAVQLLYREER